MIKKLHNQFNLKTFSIPRKSKFLSFMLIILLYVAGVNEIKAALGTNTLDSDTRGDVTISLEDLIKQAEIVKSYKITDASTEDKSCFPTSGTGVIFQRGEDCKGYHHIWQAGEDLVLNEYDNETATITGKVTDQDGKIGQVSIVLYDKAYQGNTWNAECYLSGVSADNQTYYQSFNGTITVDGEVLTVESKVAEKHYILADGASFEPGQFGLGAWTSGSFGGCTEWFGNLEPIVANCDLTVDAGNDVEVCTDDLVELTASASAISECTGGCVYPIESIARCNNDTNFSDVWLQNTNNSDKGFVTSSSEFKTYDNGSATYTAIATNGIDNIEVNITFSGYTTTPPQESPKENNCDTYNTSDWVYWTHTFGTIKTEQHGTLIVSRAGPSMQMGYGADTTRNGFGASGWLTISGGDGFYTAGDVNLKLGNCDAFDTVSAVDYMWTTTDGIIVGEANKKTITVSKSGEYMVTVADCADCNASDTVTVSVEDKVIIGDYVWFDENNNGVQDDGATGINDVKVTLFNCNGDDVAMTTTANNASGESGYYSFEVCPNSGEYYVVFGDFPEGLQFSASDAGDDTLDSDTNENGRTACFDVTDLDNPTIDGGLTEICDFKIDAGEDISICTNETIEITADISDNTADCPSVCVYPIKEEERCFGPIGDFEVYLKSTDASEPRFKASEQKFERYADNSARYTATATNGLDVIKIDALYTGYTMNTPVGSPKENNCQKYDTSDWEYWTTWSGTVTSENHGVFTMSIKEAAFQMGDGADVTRTGFGASGWFYVDGGDGFYTEGDVNVTIDPCVENGVIYKWTTVNGNIVGDANQKTITVDAPGSYMVEAINCIDCLTTDEITITYGDCGSEGKTEAAPKMATVYPVPVESGGTLTIAFDIANATNDNGEFNVVPLKATVDFPERKEDVTIMLHDMTGRVINIPRTFKIIDGKAVIYLNLDFIPSGKYILRAQGPTWSDSKNILVK